jgi:hypothetical protein
MLKDHVWSIPAGRRAAITTEVTRVSGAHSTIPVVAACRSDAIMLYFWRAERQRWRALSIDHVDSLDPDRREAIHFESPETDILDQLGRIGWCHRVGLASGLGYVFLVFKRTLDEKPDLYLDVFRISPDEDSLERVTPAPIAIPYDHALFVHPGYYLWAGFAPAESSDPDAKDRLVILSQAYTGSAGPASLWYFSIEASDDPDHYADPAAWTVRAIGDRASGYDLDARLDEGEIHCIFRQHVYPANFMFTPGGGADADGVVDVSDCAYAPLRYFRLRAEDGTVLEHEDDLPGGEHPQLQAVEPLTYTADRLSEGTVVMDLAANPPDLRYQVTRSRKHLFLRSGGDWTTTNLMDFREDRLANSPITYDAVWGIADPILFIPDRSVRIMRVARVQPLLPVFAARLEWADEVLELDLVHHNLDLGALVMTRIRHEPLGHNFGSPDLSHYAILNINHANIPDAWSTSPGTISENIGFFPYTLDPLDGKDGAFSWSLRGAGQILNNTGGDLAMEPRDAEVRSIAFVHPGDGGVRLLPDFNPGLIKPASNPSPQMHDPGAVSGDGHGTERTIVQNAEWMDIILGADPYFYTQNATIFCGLDHLFHDLFSAAHFGLFGTLSDDETTVTLDMDMLPGSPEGQAVWTALWDIWSQINAEVAPASDLITSIGNMTLEISRFIINWETVPQKVTIAVSPDFRIQYRFMRRNEGQGWIQSRFLTRVWLPAVQLTRWIRPLATTTVEVNLDYRRKYSPAVLMSDTVRIEGNFTERLERGSAQDAVALTAKPVGDCELRPVDVVPDFQWTVDGHALIWFIPLLVGLLGGLGLGWLATALSGLVAKMSAEFASLIGIAAGIATYFILVGVLENVVPDEIEKAVQARVLEYDFEALLQRNQVHTNAGEGLAEDIAWRALSESEREAQGGNRFKQGVWRMVYVTQNLCRVFREPEN